MSAAFVDECIAVLARTPGVLNAQLRDLPPAWTAATEGEGTWSPYLVMGHLVHLETVDWMRRVALILEQGTLRKFDGVDREAMLRAGAIPLGALLDEFALRRAENLERLRELDLGSAHLELQGTHPVFGLVTLRQLLATWTAHDLGHLVQINRVMARRLREEVGPWAQYLSVMK